MYKMVLPRIFHHVHSFYPFSLSFLPASLRSSLLFFSFIPSLSFPPSSRSYLRIPSYLCTSLLYLKFIPSPFLTILIPLSRLFRYSLPLVTISSRHNKVFEICVIVMSITWSPTALSVLKASVNVGVSAAKAERARLLKGRGEVRRERDREIDREIER